MNVTVHYSCDSTGDHTALSIQLIDTEKKIFKTPFEAINFAAECTECLNLDDVLEKAGVNPCSPCADILNEDLSLDSEELKIYKENKFY